MNKKLSRANHVLSGQQRDLVEMLLKRAEQLRGKVFGNAIGLRRAGIISSVINGRTSRQWGIKMMAKRGGLARAKKGDMGTISPFGVQMHQFQRFLKRKGVPHDAPATLITDLYQSFLGIYPQKKEELRCLKEGHNLLREIRLLLKNTSRDPLVSPIKASRQEQTLPSSCLP